MSFFSKVVWVWFGVLSILLGIYFMNDTAEVPKYTYLKNYNLWNDISLSEEDVLHFYSHGFLIIRDAIPVSIINDLYDNRPLHTLSWYLWPMEYIFTAISKLDPVVGCMWADINFLRDFWYFSPVVEHAVAPIFAYKNTLHIRFLTDLIFAVQLKPFIVGDYHQDVTSYGMLNDASLSLSVWIPLMNIDAEADGGSLFLVNKSSKIMPEHCHSFGNEFARDLYLQKSCTKFFDDHSQAYMSNDLVFADDYKKGDILLFDKFTFHKTQPLKDSSRKRFAYVGRFVDGNSLLNDDELTASFVQQKKNVCKHGLKYGEVIHTACYPQLFPHELPEETQAIMNNEVLYPPKDIYFFMSIYRIAKLTIYGNDPAQIYTS